MQFVSYAGVVSHTPLNKVEWRVAQIRADETKANCNLYTIYDLSCVTVRGTTMIFSGRSI